MRSNSIASVLAIGVVATSLVACGEPVSPTAIPVDATAASHLAYDCSLPSLFVVAECESLVALYDATGGDGWDDATGWLTGDDPCAWFGVTCWSPGTTVRRLDLDDNGLSGTIPDAIAGLTNLEALILDGNDIGGSIPTAVAALGQLRFLGLARNDLSGTIPPALGGMSNLQLLRLSANDLTGAIPPELGDLASLENLNLDQNRLTGSIPAELGNLGVLRLSLDRNRLSGQVPLAVAQLGGSRPPSFCSMEDNLALFMPDTPPYQEADLFGGGVICGIKLGADTDGDGIPDATDPDLVADVVASLPSSAFHSDGNRNALLARLANIEADIAAGDADTAIDKLRNLRTRVDGCGATPDMNDWIVDCAAQVAVRDIIDALIAGLGG